MSDSPITVRISAPENVERRARWVLESLFAALDQRWNLTQAGPCDIGYGCTGSSMTLSCDPAAWEFTGAEPADNDRLARAFWWLARVEEIHAPDAAFDAHGRFQYSHSALRRLHEEYGSTIAPMPVDDLVVDIAAALQVQPAAFSGNRHGAVVLSHDIDTPWRWTRRGIRRSVRQAVHEVSRMRVAASFRILGAVAAAPVWRLRRSDPWCNAQQMLALESLHDTSSTSYILLGHHHAADGDAAALKRGSARFALTALKHGGSVGLHGSYTTSDSPSRLTEEAAQLSDLTGSPTRHHRYHYLRHRPTRDWPLLEHAGFTTDASLGYAEHPGARSGFSWPYRAWDHTTDSPLNLLLIPLTLMDATLEARYLDCPPDVAWERWVLPILRDCRHRGTCVSVLWHNDKLCTRDSREWEQLYGRILAWATENDVWLTDTAGVEQEWRRRLE